MLSVKNMNSQFLMRSSLTG